MGRNRADRGSGRRARKTYYCDECRKKDTCRAYMWRAYFANGCDKADESE